MILSSKSSTSFCLFNFFFLKIVLKMNLNFYLYKKKLNKLMNQGFFFFNLNFFFFCKNIFKPKLYVMFKGKKKNDVFAKSNVHELFLCSQNPFFCLSGQLATSREAELYENCSKLYLRFVSPFMTIKINLSMCEVRCSWRIVEFYNLIN